MIRLALLSAMSGAALASGAAWGLRGTEERPGVEAARPAPVVERPEDLMAAFARGCAEAGRTPYIGRLGVVVVGRCSTLPNLGVDRGARQPRGRTPEASGPARRG